MVEDKEMAEDKEAEKEMEYEITPRVPLSAVYTDF